MYYKCASVLILLKKIELEYVDQKGNCLII